MAQLEQGQKVKVEVTFTMQDGTVVPASPPGEPLEMVIGQQTGFKPIDDALVELDAETPYKKHLSAEEAFGLPDPNLMMEIPRNQIESEDTLEPGMSMQMQDPNGNISVAMIHEVSETTVRVDANHPLAGENLDMTVTLVGLG
ncbi:FKBP-type peptidyl-prolyl cis-trans isomerase [Terasakiella sp.]|uniref:FKBP-type peptidyl-prolyl cis-trans isomerase n=1 Tax=Terasakiella sp. TaxID=2034861 RepID=UPI003AA7B8FD